MDNRIVPITQSGRAFKYQFDLEIQRVSLEIPFPCVVQVSWRRGNKSIQTKNKIDLQGQEKYFDVGEKMSMISTCYLDDNTHRFSEKNSMLNIIIFINSVPKSGGCCPLDLSQVLNPFNHKECMPRAIELPLIKCPIKNSRITLVLTGTYLQEMVQDDRSIGSGISSALNFSDSNFSMSFNRRTFQAPSKDTVSVHQEGSLPRFNSTSRRTDQNTITVRDSIARKKTDSIAQISFGAPLVSITENTGYQSEKSLSITQKVEESYQLQAVVTREKGFSINSSIPVSTSPPRTNPCSNSNKVLKQQKLKEEKFKLQTQNTQLKIFVQEQSKKLNEYLSQCSSLKQQVRTKDISLERQGEHLSSVTKDLRALQQQLDRQRQSVSSQQSRSSSKVNELQKQISIQMKEVEVKIAERQQMSVQYNQLKNQFEGVRSAYDRLKSQCDKEKQNSILLRGEAQTIKISLDQLRRQADEQIAMLNSKVTQRQAHIEHLRREILAIKQGRQQDQLSLVAGSERSNLFQNKCKQLERLLLNNNQKLRFKQRQVEEHDASLLKLTQILDEEKKTKEQVIRKAEQYRIKMQQAHIRMEEAERKAHEINIQLQWRDTELKNLQHIQDQLQVRLNQQTYESSKIFDQSQKRITELLLQVGSLQRELSSNTNSLTEKERILSAKNQELQARVMLVSQESERKLWNMSKDFQVIEKDLRASCEELKRQLQVNQEQLQRKSSETAYSLEDVSRRLSMKDTDINSLQKTNNDLRAEISQLLTDLASSKQEFNRLLDINRKNSTALRDFELMRGDLEQSNMQIKRLILLQGQKDQQLSRRQKEAEEAKAKGRVLCEEVQQLIIQNEQQQKRIKQLQQNQLPLQYNTISKLKNDMGRLQQQLQHQRVNEVCQQDANSSQMTNLMKENIQLQISLKVREQEAKKCQQYANELVGVRNKLEFELANNKELEQQLTVFERDLKDKTRSSIIESEKARMFLDQRDSFMAMYNEKSTALEIERDKTEVLDRNLRELQLRYDEAATKIRELETTLRTVSTDMSRRSDRSNEIHTYERRIKQLEARDGQKIITIEQLTRNLYKSNDTIKDLHRNIEQKTRQLVVKDRMISQVEQKLSSIDEAKKRGSETMLAANEKRNLERKNELLLGQLCSLRQKIDEQARVPCEGQLTQRVATLENQLLRKDEKLKRLQKENSKLEEENIQLNIRIMKQLTEIQKKQEGIKSEYSKSLNKVLSDSHT